MIIEIDKQRIETDFIVSLSPIYAAMPGVRARASTNRLYAYTHEYRYEFSVRLLYAQNIETHTEFRELALRFSSRFEALTMHAILMKYALVKSNTRMP